ncbi:MAG: RNA 2',3'-cyclic phosphodiesterase [Thaumarchaeota archaeon]|nr:RNA 2',3'-cyclic phosphodiesterase [Nitrososphaerota archaeon]
MGELIRTFIAVDFDNPEIVSRAQEVQRRLMEAGAVMKPVEPQNLHTTLWFFGELDKSRLQLVLDNAKKITFKAFKVGVKGVGYFPGGRRVNVIWLGIDDPAGGLNSIVEQLKDRLTRLGFKYDERGFTPHLTIGRVKRVKDRVRLLRELDLLKDTVFGEQVVDKFKVKKSTLTQRGPIYSDLLVVEARSGD